MKERGGFPLRLSGRQKFHFRWCHQPTFKWRAPFLLIVRLDSTAISFFFLNFISRKPPSLSSAFQRGNLMTEIKCVRKLKTMRLSRMKVDVLLTFFKKSFWCFSLLSPRRIFSLPRFAVEFRVHIHHQLVIICRRPTIREKETSVSSPFSFAPAVVCRCAPWASPSSHDADFLLFCLLFVYSLSLPTTRDILYFFFIF